MALAIKRLRCARGWTQEELAERAELSAPYISQLERGANAKAASARTLERLAGAFDVTIPDLFENHPTSTELRCHLEDLEALPPDLRQTVLDLARALRRGEQGS